MHTAHESNPSGKLPPWRGACACGDKALLSKGSAVSETQMRQDRLPWKYCAAARTGDVGLVLSPGKARFDSLFESGPSDLRPESEILLIAYHSIFLEMIF